MAIWFTFQRNFSKSVRWGRFQNCCQGAAGGGDSDADDGAVTLAAGDCQLAAALLVADVHAAVRMAVGVQINFGQRAVVLVCAARGLAAAGDAFFQVVAVEGEFHSKCGSRLRGGCPRPQRL